MKIQQLLRDILEYHIWIHLSAPLCFLNAKATSFKTSSYINFKKRKWNTNCLPNLLLSGLFWFETPTNFLSRFFYSASGSFEISKEYV